jgi:hypothetical protein
VLGAAAAIGVFAARPWLAQRVAAALGTSATAPARDDAQQPTHTATPNEPDAGASATSNVTVGIASTPPAPSSQPVAPRTFGRPREEHVVIDDRLQPQATMPPPVEPAPPSEARPQEPAAEPPPPPPAPVVAPPAPKPKSVPVSDADRYGI